MAPKKPLPDLKGLPGHRLMREFVKHLQLSTGQQHIYGEEILDRMARVVKVEKAGKVADDLEDALDATELPDPSDKHLVHAALTAIQLLRSL